MSMSTPLFIEVAKTVKDLFEKGYYFDKLRLDIRTKASPGIEFSFGGIQDLTTKNVLLGSVEAKYKFKDKGVTFVERWNTNNVLGTEVSIEDFYCEGVKVSCETYFVPIARRKSVEEEQVFDCLGVCPVSGIYEMFRVVYWSGGSRGGSEADSGRPGTRVWTYNDKSMTLKGSYKNSLGQLNIVSDFKSGTKPVFKTGFSMNYKGFFTGCGGVFDLNNNRIKERVIGGGYTTQNGEFSALFTINNFKFLSGMTFYRVTDSLETGLTASVSLDGTDRSFGIACKYFVDDDTAVRLKVTDKAELGIGLSQRINRSATVFLSALVNSANAKLTGRFHMGFCLELNA